MILESIVCDLNWNCQHLQFALARPKKNANINE